MAHPIELIFSPSEERPLGRDVCFLCGATLPPEHNTDEHVIPKWVQHRFNLWDQKLTLLNKTAIPYRMLTIPCCKECNSFHLARIEDRIQQAVATGVQAVREVDELTLFVWLGKIFYGLLYRQHLLKFDRSSPSSDPIVPAEVVEQFALHHKFLQAARIQFDFIPETPASIFIFETLPPDNTQAQFDLLDSLFTLSISIRLGTVGLIASLQDGRAAKLSFDYSEFNKIPLAHQLLSADMVAWTIASVRALHLFGRRGSRFVEAFWLAKVFVSTDHLKIGYLSKDTLAQWEKDKLRDAAAR